MTGQKSSKQPKWWYIAASIFALVSVVALVNGVLAVDNSPTTSSPEFAKSVLFFIFSVLSLLLSIVIFFVAKAGPTFVPKENATRLYENQNVGTRRLEPIHRTPMTAKHSCAESTANTHDKTKDNKITTTQKIGAILFVLSFLGMVFSIFVVFTIPKGPARAIALDIFKYSLFTIIFSCGMLYPGELPYYDSSSYTPPMDNL